MFQPFHVEVAGAQESDRLREAEFADTTGSRPQVREGLGEDDGNELETVERVRPDSGDRTSKPGTPDWWPVDIIQGVDDGNSDRVVKTRTTGNLQVPGVAALAWDLLSQRTGI